MIHYEQVFWQDLMLSCFLSQICTKKASTCDSELIA